MVIVRAQMPESELKPSAIHANFDIQFSGQTAQFKQVLFHLTDHGDEAALKATTPATLTDFKITPPELLFVPIKNQIPVTVDMTWQKQK